MPEPKPKKKGVRCLIHKSVVDGTFRPQVVRDKTKRRKADRSKQKAQLKKQVTS